MHARFRPTAPALAPLALLPLVLATSASAQLGAYTLGVSAGAETGMITNPRYSTGEDSADVVSRARLGLALAHRSPRTTLSAAAGGDWQHFRSSQGLSTFTYALSADVDRRLTPRFSAHGGAAMRTLLSRGVSVSAFAPAAPTGSGGEGGTLDGGTPAGGTPAGIPDVPTGVPGDALPLLPLALTHTYAATGGAAFRASTRTALSVDAGVSRVTFDVPGFVGGTTMQASARAVRQLTDKDLVGWTAQAERTAFDTRPLTAGSALLDWATQRLSHALQLRLAAGVSVFSPTPGAVAVRPAGAAELSGQVLRGTWGVHYTRTVNPVLGVGQVLATDQAGASYARVVPGGLVARVGFDKAWIHTPALPGRRFVTTVSSAEVQRVIVAGLWAGASGSQYSRAQGQAVRSRDLTLRAGYAHAWGAVPSSSPQSLRTP